MRLGWSQLGLAPGRSRPALMLPRQVREVCRSDETGSLQLIIEGKLSPRHGESLGKANFVRKFVFPARMNFEVFGRLRDGEGGTRAPFPSPPGPPATKYSQVPERLCRQGVRRTPGSGSTRLDLMLCPDSTRSHRPACSHDSLAWIRLGWSQLSLAPGRPRPALMLWSQVR